MNVARSKGLLLNIGLACVSLLITLAFAEVTWRMLVPEPFQREYWDPVVFARGPAHAEWVSASDEYSTTIRTNSDGFRGPDFPAVPNPAVRRILVVGDSFVAANQIDEGKRFVDVLPRALGSDAEVVGIGINGADPVQALQNYRVFGKKMRPDIVVHSLYIANDMMFPESPRFTLQGSGDSMRVAAITPPPKPYVTRGLLFRSHFYVLPTCLPSISFEKCT